MSQYSLINQDGNPTIIPFRVIFLKIDGVTPELGADGKAYFQRKSDDFYFNPNLVGDIETRWQAAPFKVQLIKVSDTNSPGQWKYPFDMTGLTDDEYNYQVFDENGLAENVPQFGGDIVGGGLAHQVEISADLAHGQAIFNPLSSEWTLNKWYDKTKVSQVADMKDINGDPSLENSQLQKIPV